MAADQQQLPIGGPHFARSHLTKERQAGRTPPINDFATEAYCDECGCRITVGPSGTEYGHARGVKPGIDECSHHCHGGQITSEGGR